jgi:dihydroxyacetone kinase
MLLKKLLNNPMDFVEEHLDGILLAYPDQLRYPAGEKRGIIRADAPVLGKVAIVTGGGAGHLPLFLGYVAKG